ncbi:unnamed protein product [Trifolium pratense]|uniref:Uncharacterized protein n=1 Tax=Trifolium pratense TaxID=57577 RepID=A0ACB0KRN9_TRIPR|nr:unnamed protein product [Trifolium pratense]
MDSLPYHAVHNFVNEVAFEILKKTGYSITPYIKKARENETGNIPKSIQCYMNESGASEEEACEYVKSMMYTLWKKINKEAHTSSFSQSFIDAAVNLDRIALLMYQHGDGHSIQDTEIQNLIESLIWKDIFHC